MANRTVAMSVGAALVATSIGASLYTASSAETARQAISAAHDPTTRHGELVTRVDAGGADVTALAPVAPGTAGQVLTVSDAGLPHWAAPSGGLPSGTGFVTVSSGTGGVLTASTTSAADLRTALGVYEGPTRLDVLAGYGTTTSTVDEVVARVYVDPAALARSGLTTSLTLEAVGDVVSGVTGTLTLVDLTDASTVATLSWTETTATRKAATPFTAPASGRTYELRRKKSGGGVSDYASFSAVTLIPSWS